MSSDCLSRIRRAQPSQSCSLSNANFQITSDLMLSVRTAPLWSVVACISVTLSVRAPEASMWTQQIREYANQHAPSSNVMWTTRYGSVATVLVKASEVLRVKMMSRCRSHSTAALAVLVYFEDQRARVRFEAQLYLKT